MCNILLSSTCIKLNLLVENLYYVHYSVLNIIVLSIIAELSMCIQFGFYKMTSCQIFACMCVETDAEMVQDVIKGGILGSLNLQFDLVFDAYAADSKNLPLGIVNDQSEHKSLEDIELTGNVIIKM